MVAAHGVLEAFYPANMALVALGVFVGLIMGSLPGITVTVAAVLLVSLTFGWPMIRALAMLMGCFVGAVSGGLISAITLNIPGTAAAIATTFDGYPMSRRGEAGLAIGIGMVQSFIGGCIGLVALAVGAPLLSQIALKVGPLEYFLLVLWGLTLAGSLGTESAIKGWLSGLIGFFIAMIGMDPILGTPRFTFGVQALKAGIHYIPPVIGLFGLREVIKEVIRVRSGALPEQQKVYSVIPNLKLIRKIWWSTLRWSLLGTFIGALPGTGGDVAALLAYSDAKRTVRNPSRPFGTGAWEGVAAPECANNAAVGGALIPMLTLGIPGDSVTAVIMGAFFIHGLRPGPLLMVTDPTVFPVIVAFVGIAQIFLLIQGLLFARLISAVLNVPRWLMIPVVSMLCVVGAYVVQNHIVDIWIMVAFGFLGYLLDKVGMPVGPMVLALILGPMADAEFRRAIALSKGAFLSYFFSRPIAVVILAAMVVGLVLQYRGKGSTGRAK
ncbi:MAG: tripartite tricarboxylate transporter permease [Bacillota bacterium]